MKTGKIRLEKSATTVENIDLEIQILIECEKQIYVTYKLILYLEKSYLKILIKLSKY